jgi:hypothetical protein
MKTKKQGRGELTRRVDDKAKELLGRSITLPELRLMPYVHYEAMNSHRLNQRKVNDEEWKIIAQWELAGYITTREFMTITKKFYDALYEILYLAYVDIDKD